MYNDLARPLSPAIEQLGKDVISAAIEVHRSLGPGFLESTYERALCLELQMREINCEYQHPVEVSYKGQVVGAGRVDIWVERKIIVELKTVETLIPIHTSQLVAYLKATGCNLGYLMNFNVPLLKDGIKRVVWTEKN